MLDFIPDSTHLEVQVKFNFYQNKFRRIHLNRIQDFLEVETKPYLKCINNFKTTRNS